MIRIKKHETFRLHAIIIFCKTMLHIIRQIVNKRYEAENANYFGFLLQKKNGEKFRINVIFLFVTSLQTYSVVFEEESFYEFLSNF